MATLATLQLFYRSLFVQPYPAGVVPVPGQIPGTGFFPGGHGLWQSDTAPPVFPTGGIMILGHDFHNVAGYMRSLANGQEDVGSPTWRNLLTLLDATVIDPKECFFTNFFMGLRPGNSTTGPFPGSTDAEFVARCRLFFLHQLAVQRPRLILVLGNYVPAYLGQLSNSLSSWETLRTFKSRDESAQSVIRDARFHATDDFCSNVVSLVHPSYRHINLKSRRWIAPDGQLHSGEAAEVEMVRFALNA